MFDSVFVKCPACGHELEFQSKAGECELLKFHGPVPIEIAVHLHGSIANCPCGDRVSLFFQFPSFCVPHTVTNYKEPEEDDSDGSL